MIAFVWFVFAVAGVCSVLATPSAFEKLVNSASISGPETADPTFLVTADGKSFYVDSTPRFWHEASSYSNSMNMELASITSAGQFYALNYAAKDGLFVYDHWAAGKDAHPPLQFVWETIDEAVNKEHITGY